MRHDELADDEPVPVTARGLAWLLAAVAVLAPPHARAGISLTIEQPDVRSPDVRLRWEAEGPGPFTLLRQAVPSGTPAADLLPLDPATDAWATGLSGGDVMLPGEAIFAAGTDLRAYQLIDEGDGSCSNLGWVALHRGLGAGGTILLARPERTTVHSLSQVLDQYPTVTRATLTEPELCRETTLARGRPGIDAFIPPGRAVRVAVGTATDIVVVGASGWRGAGVLVRSAQAGCQLQDHVELPFAADWRRGDELLCGMEGRDWVDADLDGRLDGCPLGAFDGAHATAVIQASRQTPGIVATRAVHRGFGTRPTFSGVLFDIDPPAGQSFAFSGLRAPPTVVLDIADLGADPACACADSDGDGDDDCTERLFGTDPSDAASHGPDADGDGILDDVDDCPAAADPAQLDGDGDGFGDACDPDPADPANSVVDRDGDGVLDPWDSCPDLGNPGQEDQDFDRFGDPCDNCPLAFNDQSDSDRDGRGDACDTCLFDPEPDPDEDRVCSGDNCPNAWNGGQEDSDGDGFGNACDCSPDVTLPALAGLRLAGLGGSAAFVRELTWEAGRPGHVYDVVTGPLERVFGRGDFSQAECMASGLDVRRVAEGPRDGDAWYLVRARGPCSTTSWPAAGDSCP